MESLQLAFTVEIEECWNTVHVCKAFQMVLHCIILYKCQQLSIWIYSSFVAVPVSIARLAKLLAELYEKSTFMRQNGNYIYHLSGLPLSLVWHRPFYPTKAYPSFPPCFLKTLHAPCRYPLVFPL